MNNSQFETSNLTVGVNEHTGDTCFVYRGPSMAPIFKNGDLLYLSLEKHDFSAGDIIVFSKLEKSNFVVHRIVAKTDQGYVTRGDHNLRTDEDVVPFKHVIGKVIGVEKQGKRISVTGGRRGLCLARLRWSLQASYTSSLPWLGAPYRWLKARRWVGRVWHPHITTVQLQTPDGTMIKYVVRGKTVATWQPELKRFLCSRPYDLIIFPPE